MLECEGGKQCGNPSSSIFTGPEPCHQLANDYQETTSLSSSPTSNKVENSASEMNSTKDTEESVVSVYAVQEKVKSKVSLVINSFVCASEENSLLTKQNREAEGQKYHENDQNEVCGDSINIIMLCLYCSYENL